MYKILNNSKLRLLFAIGFTLAITSQLLSAKAVTVVEEFFDFGHVGIEYKLFHKFKVINSGVKRIKIDSIDVPCDCSAVRYEKEWMEKGDTLDFILTFDTKDFYGPVNRKFKIYVSVPEKKTISLIYLANVGQWTNGFKPIPFSVFFLPTHKMKTVKIPNKFFDKISLELERQYDNSFTVEVIKAEAAKGDMLELKLSPNPELVKGTYHSNFTLKVTIGENEEPTFLTIPVKIARF
ncbi:MAG: DUF1573 domain-containing protein [candidate division Zixibacteria bacterium]|nr:DUF1573 domain-containing protein [candidate division Zixibacteria bacterium]